MYEAGSAEDALRALDAAAEEGASLDVRFAALVRALEPEAVEAFCAKIKAPAGCRDLAVLAARHGNALADAASLDAEELLGLLEAADAWRRPERFTALVQAALAGEKDVEPARQRLRRAHDATLAVDAGAVARNHAAVADIKAAVAQARLAALKNIK